MPLKKKKLTAAKLYGRRSARGRHWLWGMETTEHFTQRCPWSSVASSGLDHRSKKKWLFAEIEEGDWFLFSYLTLLSVIPAQPDGSGVKQAGSKKPNTPMLPFTEALRGRWEKLSLVRQLLTSDLNTLLSMTRGEVEENKVLQHLRSLFLNVFWLGKRVS